MQVDATDPRELTREAIDEEILRLEDERRAIREQLATARRRAAATREYADGEWLRRAEHAFHLKGRRIAALQVERGRRRREEARGRDWAQRFVDAAELALAPDVFAELRASADREAAA